MCRNIKLLYNFQPPATHEEVAASALQYVRKISGMRAPSAANQAAFDAAVAQITETTHALLDSLQTQASPRDRQTEAQRARERGQQRDARVRAQLLNEG